MEGRFKGLLVAHFTDENHIGVLPQSGTQAHREGFHIDTDFTLAKRTPLVRVDILHRVLERDDVQGRVLVHMAQHRSKGRTLAGTSRTADQHEPFHELKGFEHGLFVEVEFSELRGLDLD